MHNSSVKWGHLENLDLELGVGALKIHIIKILKAFSS